ncbi:hypothetical protein TSUD_44350, partial [Trifolium subterraneum]
MKFTVTLALLCIITVEPWRVNSEEQRLLVNMTLVAKARDTGALCLDGSLPAYHLDRGYGAGQNNWLLQFEGGGWCNDLPSCLERALTRRGSTRYMTKWEVFSGILSNNATLNPGCSAGGLATFHHCDNFTKYLPINASVKCLSDAGFFLDGRDISLNHTMRYFVKSLVTLQGIEQNLNRNCTSALSYPDLCFFPQYVLKYISTPYFILNSAYDVFQFHHILVPPSADPRGHWNHCKLNPAACTPDQIDTLQ